MNARVPYLLLTPFAIIFLASIAIPIGYAFYTSLFSNRLIGGEVFVGGENYVQAFQSGILWTAILQVLVYGAVEVPIMLGLALLFAVIIDLRLAVLGPLFRIAYFLPYAVPAAVSTLMWGFMLEPRFGPFNQIAGALGLPQPQFLSPQGIFPSVGIISLWQTTGFNMLIFYTALRTIPPDLNEAAVMDGAGLWDLVVRIRLPLLGRAFTLTVFLSIIGTLQLFTEPFLLRTFNGGVPSTLTPNMYIYSSAFSSQEYEYAAAVSLLLAGLSVLGAAIVLGSQVLSRVRKEDARAA